MKAYFLYIICFVFSTNLIYSQPVRDTLIHKTNRLWFSIKNDDNIAKDNGKIIIKNKTINNIFLKYNVKSIKKYHQNSYDKELDNVYEIECDCNEFKLMHELQKFEKLFNYVELIPKNNVEFTPNDYDDTLLWHLNKIKAREAWDITKDSPPVKIAITDNGFDTLHVDLLDNIIYKHGNVWHIDTSLPNYSHGTCVSGLAAMTTNNNMGFSSIGGLNCNLMLYKGLSYSNIKRAADHGARVINASWSGSLYSQSNQNIINYAYNKGAVIVAAASTTDYCKYPACYDHVLAVAGTNKNDIKFYDSGHYPEVDISAPAENLVCPRVGGNHDEYSYTSGWTSGASALVTGLCGMIISVNPDVTPDEVEYILESTADPIDHLPGNSSYIGRLGAGRINAYKAVLCSKELSYPLNLTGSLVGTYDRFFINIENAYVNKDVTIHAKDISIEGPFEVGMGKTFIVDNDYSLSCPEYPKHILIEMYQYTPSYWKNINFPDDYDNPVVIAGPLTTNGWDPATIRISSVTSSSCDIQIDEWDYLDGYRLSEQEQMSMLVIEAGQYNIGGLKVEAGIIENVNHNFQSHSFSQNFEEVPVVLTQVITQNDPTAVVTRHRNTGTTSFELKLQEEQAADGTHGNEQVAFIAIEPGNSSINGHLIEVGRTENAVDHNWHTISFNNTFSSTPGCFIAGLQTYNGGDPCSIKRKDLNSTSVKVMVEEEQSEDTETNHTNEVVGYIIIE